VEPVFKQEINKSYLQLIHNRERGSRDVSQLQYDKDLEKFAQDWAEYMASRRRLKHSNLGWSGYRSKGENIAMGQRTEDEVLESWMKSRGHKKNILNSSYTHVGFGCARTQDGVLYWCACFGG
jgi:uncharacterized protein YkwD